MVRRFLLAAVAVLAAFTSAQTPATTTAAPAFAAPPTAAPAFAASPTAAPAPTPFLPFPNPTSPCQQCANANNAPAQCSTAYKGVSGQFCYKFLSSGVTQACCCPATSRCAPQTANVNICQCDSGAPSSSSSYVVVRRWISPWVWVAVALGAVLLAFSLYWCCCRPVQVIEPVYVQPAYGQPAYVQQGYVHGGPVVVGGPGYGYGGYGYGGGDVAAGVAIGATAGMVGGMAMGAAMAGHGGYYGGGGYAVAADPGAGGGFSGGGDFAGDF